MRKEICTKSVGLYLNKIGKDQWVCFNPGERGGPIVISGRVKEILEKCGADDVEEKKILDALIYKGILIGPLGEKQPPSVKAVSGKASYWFHVTNQCNLQCTYCYIEKDAEGMEIETASRLTSKIISDCKEKGITSVSFKFAGGEPVLALHVIREVMRIARSEKPEGMTISYGMLTNGTLITPAIASFLRESGILVSVSLDGTRAGNDKTRIYRDGSGSYGEIVQGIHNLRQVGISPLILTVVSPENMESLPEFMDWLIEENLCSRFSFCRDKDLLEQYGMQKYQEELVQYLHAAYKILGEKMPAIPLDHFHNIGNLNFSGPLTRYCGRGSYGFAVSHKGKFSLCQETIGSPVNIDEWENHVGGFQRIELPGESLSECHECLSCDWKYVCGGDCPELKRKFFGHSGCPSPYCNVLQAVIPKLVDLRGKQLVEVGKKIEERREGLLIRS